jgi:hypothetical protein
MADIREFPHSETEGRAMLHDLQMAAMKARSILREIGVPAPSNLEIVIEACYRAEQAEAVSPLDVSNILFLAGKVPVFPLGEYGGIGLFPPPHYGKVEWSTSDEGSE